MTELEKIGLEKLLHHLFDAQARCNEKNDGRMDHERIFLKSDIEKAIKVCNALNPQ